MQKRLLILLLALVLCLTISIVYAEDIAGGSNVDADFTASPTSGTVPLSVSFTAVVTGKANNICWEYGDGSTEKSTLSPTHTYNTPGDYTVNLTINSNDGMVKVIKKNFVSVSGKKSNLVASFTARPTSGISPLTVKFTDTSTGSPTSWYWDFGDGKTENRVAIPAHTYTNPGTYTVTLTVKDNNGNSDTIVKRGYVTVSRYTPGIRANFDIIQTAPLTIQFYDESIGRPTKWSWDFGDGTTAQWQENPLHKYSKPDTYLVTMTASNPSGDFGTIRKTITVTGNGINADFTATPTSGVNPLTVQFTDKSTGYPTMWSYDFGDGQTDNSGGNPTHTYVNEGTYTVKMTASDQTGVSDTETKTNYITVGPSGGILADFSASPTTGETPLEVQFTDLSTGNPTSWSWDFGDGGTDNIADPIYTYNTTGTYSVTLNASSQADDDTETKTDYITVTDSSSITADFSASSTTGEAPLEVQFTDLSTGNPTTWSWNFGDGGTDNIADPTYTYNTAGTYSVTLTASNQADDDTETKTDYITVTDSSSITADFSASSTTGEAPLEVQFTDQSTGNPTTWSWNFGDGGTDDSVNPSHEFENSDTYTVTLTVSNGDYTDAADVTITVTEGEPVIGQDVGPVEPTPTPDDPINAAFSASPDSGEAPLIVHFSDTSSGNPTTWSWDFGDGESGSGATPVHTYQNAGSYIVTLTVSNGDSTDTADVTITVTDANPVIVTNIESVKPTEMPTMATMATIDPISASFSASPDSGEAPLTVYFSDTSSGNPTSWSWNFGDGESGSGATSSHTYQNAGSYIVTLKASNEGASDTATSSIYVTEPQTYEEPDYHQDYSLDDGDDDWE